MGVRPGCPAFQAADIVMVAIDALATLLTGERGYFALDLNSTPDGLGAQGGFGALGPQAEKREREAGRLPWRRADEAP